MTTQDQLDAWISEARDLGAEHAQNAASWTYDGNSDIEERARVLQKMRDGDPEAYDFLPNMPNLSGKWADDPTPQSLFAEITGEGIEDDEDIDVSEALADAYMDAVSEMFGPACEAELIRFCEESKS